MECYSSIKKSEIMPIIATCVDLEIVILSEVSQTKMNIICYCFHVEPKKTDMNELIYKPMAPHSSTLAWKIPWTEEPGRLQSMGSLGVPQLSDFTFTFHFHALKKEMATHFSVLAWRIPGMGEPVGLPSMGSHRVGHD